MTEDESEILIAWGHMQAATSLMRSAWGMIFEAFRESSHSGDPLGVDDRLRKLMNEAKELTADMQCDTRKLFPNPLDDEKSTTAE